MKTERLIHASIFILLLVGLAVLSAWASATYIDAQANLILVIAAIPLFWGLILLAMYLSFNKLGWNWWT